MIGASYSINVLSFSIMLSRQLPPISPGNDPLDLVVIGCGPAGLALAAESAKLGLSVGLIGVWEDEFEDLGLEKCLEHVWKDTIVYLDDSEPILLGRAYERVSRHLLHAQLLDRRIKSGVSFLSSKAESIFGAAADGSSLVACEHNIAIACR